MEPLLPKMKKRRGCLGRRATEYREIMDAIFWMLSNGAQWRALPKIYPPKSKVHGRFQMLVQQGFFQQLAKELSKELQAVGLLDLEETFLDGTFASAKKGVRKSGAPLLLGLIMFACCALPTFFMNDVNEVF